MPDPPFMYGSHYSSPGYVLFYLVRVGMWILETHDSRELESLRSTALCSKSKIRIRKNEEQINVSTFRRKQLPPIWN